MPNKTGFGCPVYARYIDEGGWSEVKGKRVRLIPVGSQRMTKRRKNRWKQRKAE
jgi:hypothetical protein